MALLALRRWATLSRSLVVAAVVGLAGSSLGAGAGVAATTVRDMTIDAVVLRTTTLECRTERGIEACVWPENTERVDELARIADEVNPLLERWNLAPINRLTQSPDPQGAVAVAGGDHLVDDDLRYSMAAGYVDRAAGCVGASGRWRDERVGLVGLAAGLRLEALNRLIPPDAADAAAVQLRRSRSDPKGVRDWFAARAGHPPCGESR